MVIKLVRALTMCFLQLSLLFLARHVPGLENEVADACSHKQMERFCQLAQDTDQNLVCLPPEIWRLGEQKPVEP